MLWVDSILDKLGQKILNFKWKTDLAPNSDASKLSHVGRVVRVDPRADGPESVLVQSKFGIGESYEHPVELVLPGYGTHAGFYTSAQNVMMSSVIHENG